MSKIFIYFFLKCSRKIGNFVLGLSYFYPDRLIFASFENFVLIRVEEKAHSGDHRLLVVVGVGRLRGERTRKNPLVSSRHGR